MRVFAPGHLALVSYDRHNAYGIPLDGEWRDVPDYFRQITSGKPINDVTHAKLVDPVEYDYHDFDAVCRVGGQTRDFSQIYMRGVRQDLYFQPWEGSITGYEAEKQTVILEPSPNYKGKHPRVEQKEITVRHLRPFMVEFNADYSQYGSGIHSLYCFNVTIYLYLPQYEDLSIRDSRNGFPAYQYLLATTVRSRRMGSYWEYWQEPTGHLASDEFDGLWRIIEAYQGQTPNASIGGTIESLYRSVLRWIEANHTALVNIRRGSSRSLEIVELLPRDFPEYEPRWGYILSEDYIFGDRVDPMLLGRSSSFNGYWINWFTQHALLEALESLPRLNENSIQNLLEIVSFIKSLVVDHKVDVPESLADAWLSYRYQYGTTKMDVEDAIKFVNRRIDLGTLDRTITGRAVVKNIINGTTVTCRCQVDVTPKNISTLKRIWRALDTYGLTPDFYVIWDSIPYSFMVDWFLPIGNIASVEDANAMYFSGEYYDLSNICYSLSYVREVDGLNISCYTRWAGSVPSSLNSMYWFDPPSATHKTVGYRFLDAGSIFIG